MAKLSILITLIFSTIVCYMFYEEHKQIDYLKSDTQDLHGITDDLEIRLNNHEF